MASNDQLDSIVDGLVCTPALDAGAFTQRKVSEAHEPFSDHEHEYLSLTTTKHAKPTTSDSSSDRSLVAVGDCIEIISSLDVSFYQGNVSEIHDDVKVQINYNDEDSKPLGSENQTCKFWSVLAGSFSAGPELISDIPFVLHNIFAVCGNKLFMLHHAPAFLQ